jgi:hypothetical protein
LDDVLIIGSVVSNCSHFQLIGGDPLGNIGHVHRKYMESANMIVAKQVMHMLLDVFPGAIIWHSFPHLNLDNNGEQFSGDLNDWNKAFSYVDSLVKCSSLPYDRILYVDLRLEQETRQSEYRDVIHHPGKLSMDLVAHMLRKLKYSVS